MTPTNRPLTIHQREIVRGMQELLRTHPEAISLLLKDMDTKVIVQTMKEMRVMLNTIEALQTAVRKMMDEGLIGRSSKIEPTNKDTT